MTHIEGDSKLLGRPLAMSVVEGTLLAMTMGESRCEDLRVEGMGFGNKLNVLYVLNIEKIRCSCYLLTPQKFTIGFFCFKLVVCRNIHNDSEKVLSILALYKDPIHS